MTDCVESPGTSAAFDAAYAELSRSISVAQIRGDLTERIVERLQTDQHHGGMRVLLRASQSAAGRLPVVNAVLATYGDYPELRDAVDAATAVAAKALWDAEARQAAAVDLMAALKASVDRARQSRELRVDDGTVGTDVRKGER